jgi:Cu/Zn superoxide dismutase
MRKFNHRKTRIGAAAVATGVVVAGGALAVSLTGSAQAASASQAELTHHVSAKQTAWVQLAPMPQGTVRLSRDSSGGLDATVNAFGLTPGSSHTVELVNRDGQEVTSFGTLTANGVGQAWARLDSGYTHRLGGSRVVILNGTAGDWISAEPIAHTRWHVEGGHSYRFTPVEVSADGTRYGTPQGWAKVTYDPNAKTISVTVNASGVTPGAHAAHIHVGSCASQGAVKYMLMDFTANARGRIDHETRTVSNVTTPLPASGWYLNLHQGNGNNIVDANGNPTINFRPLLCGNIVPQS